MRSETILAAPGYWRIFLAVLAGTLVSGPASAASAAASRDALDAAQNEASQPVSRWITDEVGRRVAIPAEIRRIVTLSPDLTETVYALGLDERLVGNTSECDRPAAAKSKPHVGEPLNPSLEAIATLRPDLVLASTSINRLETARALERLGIPVYTCDPHTVRGMLDSIRHLAELLGASPQGTAVVARLEERLGAVQARLASEPVVHVLFVVWTDPLITIGQNTFLADALRWAGAESVAISKQNWPQVNLEELVRLQPEYIVFAGHGAETAATELADLRARAVWKDLAAVRAGRVVDIGEEAVRPSPGLVDAIEELARELHPEAFAEKSEIRNSKNETRLALQPMGETHEECRLCVR